MSSNCKFCNLDQTKIFNTILEETDNFIVITALGSLVEGYILIVTKKHLYNMGELNKKQRGEYLALVEKYRNLFHTTYKRYPIVFEHGTTKNNIKTSASSIVHAHTHIVNHNYNDEANILHQLHFQKIENEIIEIDKNYIFYISPNHTSYLTYQFKSVSQLMRLLIAKDLNLTKKYDWKQYPFIENVILTIHSLKNDTHSQE